MEKVYLTLNERDFICMTPQMECWICDKLSKAIEQDDKGFFIPVNAIDDIGIQRHLEQIIKKPIEIPQPVKVI